jgi:hypothetical protein
VHGIVKDLDERDEISLKRVELANEGDIMGRGGGVVVVGGGECSAHARIFVSHVSSHRE